MLSRRRRIQLLLTVLACGMALATTGGVSPAHDDPNCWGMGGRIYTQYGDVKGNAHGGCHVQHYHLCMRAWLYQYKDSAWTFVGEDASDSCRVESKTVEDLDAEKGWCGNSRTASFAVYGKFTARNVYGEVVHRKEGWGPVTSISC